MGGRSGSIGGVTHWTRLQLVVTTLRDPIAHGADVPGRIVVCEVLRRDGWAAGIDTGGADLEAVDWSGLDDAIVRLEVSDLDVAPELVGPAGGEA